MELRQLACFVTVAEELHFGRAAQRLRMTQPPLSRKIQPVEQNPGMCLFERGRSGWSAASEQSGRYEYFALHQAPGAAGSGHLERRCFPARLRAHA